ncbi:MAG: hypothetical protein Q7S83_04075 [bacterium]|nr:hypothetical protein [bacterium]
MDKDSEDILKKAIKQAIANSTKRTNVWPPPQPSFLTNYLVKSIGTFIDLSIKETGGKIVVFFQLQNYKKPPQLDTEKIFKQGVFWTAFFDVENYRDTPANISNFEQLALSDQVIFLKKYLK